jgi:hypothetical protein
MEASTSFFYDAFLPMTRDKHTLIQIAENQQGHAVFYDHVQMDNGTPGPAQTFRLINQRGDRIVAVNGVGCLDMTYDAIKELLHQSRQQQSKYVWIRFQSTKQEEDTFELFDPVHRLEEKV